MTAALLLILKLSVAVLIMAIGMGSKPGDALYLWRHPGKLIRAVLAMYVLVPLAAFLLVRFLPLTPAVKATVLVLALSAGAPLLPRKLSRLGNDAYIYSLVVTSSVLALVAVPAFVTLLARRFGVDADLPVEAAIVKTFVVPLGTGTLIRVLFPRVGNHAAGVIGSVAGVALAVSALVLVATHWRLLLEIPWPGVAALTLMMLVSLAIGHMLGGPMRDEQTTLAISCATRHVGIALIVATAFQGPRTVTAISAYLIASLLVTIPYLQFRLRNPSTKASE